MKTTAAYMRSPWQFELRGVLLPRDPPVGELLLRVDACGICETDLVVAAAGTRDWAAFGHEVVGTVVEPGPGVSHLRVGQTVVLAPTCYCGRCDLCRNGRSDLCTKGPSFLGRSAMGFSRHMLAPAGCAVPYEGLAPDVAALVAPAGAAYDMVKTAGVRLGDRVALIGPGPMALAAIPMLLGSGAASVLCIGHSHSEARLAVACEFGAEVLAVDAALDERKELHGRFNHVLVTATVSSIPSALPLLAYGGILTYSGMGTGDSTISFDANDFHMRKLQLRASCASPALYFPAVIAMLKNGTIPGRLIVSHRFALNEISAAMTLLRDNKTEAVKVVVIP